MIGGSGRGRVPRLWPSRAGAAAHAVRRATLPAGEERAGAPATHVASTRPCARDVSYREDIERPDGRTNFAECRASSMAVISNARACEGRDVRTWEDQA
jgi:hypothetical protein